MKRVFIDLDDLAARYHRGESVLYMSKELGVCRGAITKRLSQIGLKVRSGSEANLIRMAKLSKAERLALASAAHAAVRGRPQSHADLCKRAISREQSARVASKYEMRIMSWLRDAGIQFTPQKAIGPYNVDIAISESCIAVEVFGGNWHATGLHAARYRERTDYLLSCGWLPFIIWVRKRLIDWRCVEQIIALHQIGCSNETKWTQEHVIRSDGKTTPIAEVNPNNGTLIMNVQSGNERRAANGRFC